METQQQASARCMRRTEQNHVMVTKNMVRNSIAAAAVFGAVIAGGSAIASAETGSSSAPSTSTSTDDTADDCKNGGPHDHTDVTGDELTQVTDAVTAYDSTVTVESVQKDPDGSYDVRGSKDGDRLMLEVSADLQDITERQPGPGMGGPGDQGGPGGKHGAGEGNQNGQQEQQGSTGGDAGSADQSDSSGQSDEAAPTS